MLRKRARVPERSRVLQSSLRLGLLERRLLLLPHCLHRTLIHGDLHCVHRDFRRRYLDHDDARHVRHGADDLCGLAVALWLHSRLLLLPTQLLPRLRSTATQLLALD